MGLFSKDPATHFPLVKGRRLDGTDVQFPQDLPTDATLLVVLFQDALDPLADQWARLGDRLREAHGERFAVIEAPVSSKKMKLLGDLGTLGIRGQIETEEERARTVPLYTDVKKLRKRLKLKSGDVYAFLLRRDGGIAWRGEGDIDMEEIQDLEAAVAEVLSSPAPDPTDHPDLDGDGEPEDETAASASEDAPDEDGGEETDAEGADDSDRAAAD
jgi:hypothetical protein